MAWCSVKKSAGTTLPFTFTCIIVSLSLSVTVRSSVALKRNYQTHFLRFFYVTGRNVCLLSLKISYGKNNYVFLLHMNKCVTLLSWILYRTNNCFAYDVSLMFKSSSNVTRYMYLTALVFNTYSAKLHLIKVITIQFLQGTFSHVVVVSLLPYCNCIFSSASSGNKWMSVVVSVADSVVLLQRYLRYVESELLLFMFQIKISCNVGIFLWNVRPQSKYFRQLLL
jgi:hypothetical protein